MINETVNNEYIHTKILSLKLQIHSITILQNNMECCQLNVVCPLKNSYMHWSFPYNKIQQ